MKKECSYCKYARQDNTGMWYCTLITCIVEEAKKRND